MRTVAILTLASALAGCGLPTQTILTPVTFRQALMTTSRTTGEAERVVFPEFELLLDQVHDRVPRRRRADARLHGLPQELEDCALMEKLMECSEACLYTETPEIRLPANTDDYEEFALLMARTACKTFDDRTNEDDPRDPAGEPGSFIQRWLFYLDKYARGEFVDRFGATYSRPQISNGVPNETIVGITTVTLEALYDHAFQLPVYYKFETIKVPEYVPTEEDPDLFRQFFRDQRIQNFFTNNNRRPTTHEFDRREEQIRPGGPLTEDEIEATQFVSAISAEQSKALSGLIVRLFGDVEFGYIVAGHFSVGDNDTLAKLAETVVEVSSRRLTEVAALRFFERYSGPGSFRDEGSVREIIDIVDRRRR